MFIAEAVIASPRIPDQGLDAHLLRLVARVVGLVGVLVVLFWGGNRLGLPLYGLIAGVSVGGLAIALAAQGTLENFLGSLNLFADRPVRIGDLCRYGSELGTVEEIGLRSTRIRGSDRTLTTVPNSDFSKMQITNFSRRDRMLLKTVLGLRYETTPDQLRHLLTRLRELLVAHPRILKEPMRVRFVGFGDSSLNVEILAYVGTRDFNEFLGIQEDMFLRVIDLMEASGTGFAFPSQTLYLSRDAGLDAQQKKAAEAEVNEWREQETLQFPNLDPEHRLVEGFAGLASGGFQERAPGAGLLVLQARTEPTTIPNPQFRFKRDNEMITNPLRCSPSSAFRAFAAASPEDGSVLPFPPTPSASVAGRTLQESKHQRRVEPERLKKVLRTC